ncbi:MAG TPA: amino acid permease [Bacteroidota bacterium]|nr:amino acid permease [Bacteroidota bacterium]
MADLKRELSRFDMTMIAIGSTIGSGIFLTPALIAHALPSPSWIVGIWIVGGVMALTGALTFAELGGMMPGAGGVYVYLNEAYGPLAGFLYGWAYFLVCNTGGIAALSLAFATYLGHFMTLSPGGIRLAAIAGLLVVTVINIRGVKIGGVFSDVFTIMKLAGIAFLIVAGIGWGTNRSFDFSTPLDLHGSTLGGALATAMVGALWSYGGWQHASYAAGEARDPRRTIPFAMVAGATVVVVVYVLTNLSYMLTLPVDAIGSSGRLASDAMERIMGPAGAGVIAAAIFISTFGTTGIYTLTAPRIYFAMARDGLFFQRVAAVHPRYHTPALAIAVQTIWAVTLILFWGTFESLISYVVFTDWIFFALAAAGVFILRARRPEAERPYRTLGYPVTPLVFVAISVWFVGNTLVNRLGEALAGLGFLAAGVPVFLYWRKRKGARRGDSEEQVIEEPETRQGGADGGSGPARL